MKLVVWAGSGNPEPSFGYNPIGISFWGLPMMQWESLFPSHLFILVSHTLHLIISNKLWLSLACSLSPVVSDPALFSFPSPMAGHGCLSLNLLFKGMFLCSQCPMTTYEQAKSLNVTSCLHLVANQGVSWLQTLTEIHQPLSQKLILDVAFSKWTELTFWGYPYLDDWACIKTPTSLLFHFLDVIENFP